MLYSCTDMATVGVKGLSDTAVYHIHTNYAAISDKLTDITDAYKLLRNRTSNNFLQLTQ